MGLAGLSFVGTASRASAQELELPQPPPTTFTIEDDTPPLAHLAKQPAAQPPTLPETRVEAQPTLPDTNVTGQQPAYPDAFQDGNLTGTILDGTLFSNTPTDGYRADTSTAGSIIAIPQNDLPFTVNPITRATLDDQIALRTSDILRNAGGVVSRGDGQFFDRMLIRGQQLGNSSFRKDGFLDSTAVPRDYQNVERVEILKGPASVLYGAGDAAGIVNIVTKKPVYDRFAIADYTFGSFGQDRFTVDANTYSEGGNFLFRLNAAQESSNSFVDFDYLNRMQIAPVVTWLVDDVTTITWNGEYHKDHRLGYQGVPAVGGNPLALPPSRFVGEPANDFFHGEEFRQSLVLNRQLNDDWTLMVGGYSLFTNVPLSTTAASAPLIPLPFPPFTPIEPEFSRLRSDSPDQKEETHSFMANLGGDFYDNLGFRHRLVTGLEYVYLDSNSTFNASTPWTGAFSGPFPVPPFPAPFLPTPLNFDVNNPVYTDPDTFFLFGLRTNAFRSQRFGAYFQDLVDINPYWKAMGGVRVDTVDFQFDRVITAGGPPQAIETNQVFNRASPRAGLIYQPFADESLAFYYTYSTSFSPPGGGAYFSPNPLNPVLNEIHEAGIKTMLLDNLQVTACGYHTLRENDTFVLTPSVITQVGEVRTQGAEINVIGALTDYWSIIANYCYCDAAVFDNGLGLNGTPARNVPNNNANIWTRYNLIDDGTQIVGAALGWVYVGERPSDLFPNPITLPSYSRYDLGFYYQRGQFAATAYLENIGDIQYATGSSNAYQIFQGAPFNARATLSYSF